MLCFSILQRDDPMKHPTDPHLYKLTPVAIQVQNYIRLVLAPSSINCSVLSLYKVLLRFGKKTP